MGKKILLDHTTYKMAEKQIQVQMRIHNEICIISRYNRADELKMNEGRCDKCFPKTCHRGWLCT